MKHALNTLYVTQPKSYLFKEGSTVVVKKDKERILQIPIHTIGQIVCFGFEIMLSPPLMAFCAENGVSVAWMAENGKFLGRLEGPVKGNVLLRREQYRWADDKQKCLEIARCVLAAKINNSRMNLQRFLRNQSEHEQQESIRMQVYKLAKLLLRVESCQDLDEIRGIEGESALGYFEQAASKDPSDADAHYYVAGVHFKRGDARAAGKAAKKALHSDAAPPRR